MESFGALKRRTTDLMNNMPKPAVPTEMPQFPSLGGLSSKLPALPKMPALGGYGGQPSTAKATWERIDAPHLPRSSHSINVVSGNAYLFGGEINPREPVDNDMHVIVLPFSSAGADYYTVKAKPAAKPKIPTVVEPVPEDLQSDEKEREKELSDVSLASPGKEGEEAEETADGEAPSHKGKQPARADADNSSLGDVPAPRVGHATAVIGTRIFLFGGRGGPDMQPLEENGRVWVYDTKTHLWSYLDPYLPAAEPVSPAFADKRQHYPAARSYHSAVGVDQPRDFAMRKPKRTETWTEWAQGDSNVVGTPQQPIVGNIASNSRDEDDEGYGTLIVHGGCFAQGRANDLWAFDVHTRVWQELPSAPGKPRGGTCLAVAAGKLWRFGGFNGESAEGGQLDYLELGVDDFNDRSGEMDVVLSARGAWKSILPEDLPGAAAEAEKPLTGDKTPHWPGNRSVAGLQPVTIGGSAGREYLLLVMGEREPSNAGHEAAGKFWDDVWAYELPKAGAAASVLGMFGRARSASKADQSDLVGGKWFRVETEAYDDEDDAAAQGPVPRGWFASAHMGELEERGVVLFGGLESTNKRLGDGWVLRFGPDKREA